jgi:hypothetical protein
MVVALSSNGILTCTLKEPASSIARVLAALPIFWAASSLPGSGEHQAEARLLMRHVWTFSHPASIRPALFEASLRWLAY